MNFKTQYVLFLFSAKRFVANILSYLPRRLPQGLTEFNSFAEEVIGLAGLPDNDSTRFAVAVQIMHLGQTESHKPRRFFVKTMIKGAASQVASHIINEIKDRQQQKAAQLAVASTNTEAPASSGASDDQAKQA